MYRTDVAVVEKGTITSGMMNPNKARKYWFSVGKIKFNNIKHKPPNNPMMSENTIAMKKVTMVKSIIPGEKYQKRKNPRMMLAKKELTEKRASRKKNVAYDNGIKVRDEKILKNIEFIVKMNGVIESAKIKIPGRYLKKYLKSLFSIEGRTANKKKKKYKLINAPVT